MANTATRVLTARNRGLRGADASLKVTERESSQVKKGLSAQGSRERSPPPGPAVPAPAGFPRGSEEAATALSSARLPGGGPEASPLEGRRQAARQAQDRRPGPGPAPAEGAPARRPEPGPGPAQPEGGPGAHHCAPRWSVVLIRAPSSDFWVSASGRSGQPPPSAILSAAPAQPVRTSASRTACRGHACTHARAATFSPRPAFGLLPRVRRRRGRDAVRSAGGRPF